MSLTEEDYLVLPTKLQIEIISYADADVPPL